MYKNSPTDICTFGTRALSGHFIIMIRINRDLENQNIESTCIKQTQQN